jgi:hypothetical protein
MRLTEHFKVVEIGSGQWRRINSSSHRPGRTDMTRVHLIPVSAQARRYVEERASDRRYEKSGEGRHKIGARMIGVAGEYFDSELRRWMPAIRLVESSLQEFEQSGLTTTFEHELAEYFN